MHELVGNDRALERRDDVAERHLPWIAGELMPAVRTADAPDDADATQPAQQLVEVGLGDLLAGGDFGALHRALPETSGELDDGVGTIVAAHGESHGLRKLSKSVNIVRNLVVIGPALPPHNG